VLPQRLVAGEGIIEARGVFGVLVGKWVEGESWLKPRDFIWIPIGHARLLLLVHCSYSLLLFSSPRSLMPLFLFSSLGPLNLHPQLSLICCNSPLFQPLLGKCGWFFSIFLFIWFNDLCLFGTNKQYIYLW
jgi:hypothetical protein